MISLKLENQNNEQINIIIQHFLSGQIIIMPTETVYGLCCIANNDNAIKKIYQIKKRDFTKPLTVLVYSIDQIKEFAILVNEALHDLEIGNTVILKTKQNNLSKLVFGDQNPDSIGVRKPNNNIIINLLSQINQPIVATSVNLSGQQPLVKIDNLDKQMSQHIDLIIEGDKICSGKPSSVINYCITPPIILRK